MSVPPALIALAARAGAPLVERILRDQIGGKGGDLAADVLRRISGAAGIEPDESWDSQIASRPEVVGAALREAEAEAPEMLAIWAQEAQAKADLLQAELAKGGPLWTWAWRPATMWLIGLFWLWALIAQPLLAFAGLAVPPPDMGALTTFSLAFLGLYMGGHTVKDIAAKWRGGAP